MCGIAGILLPQAADRRRLAPIGAMTTALRHRGPDAGGVWTDGDAGIALGHRRLAIMDLSAAGSQPMRVNCRKKHRIPLSTWPLSIIERPGMRMASSMMKAEEGEGRKFRAFITMPDPQRAPAHA